MVIFSIFLLFSNPIQSRFPSYKEPFGMVFIECMACGTPTIGANSGGPTEFVKPGQGVLVEEEADWRTEPGMKRRSTAHCSMFDVFLELDVNMAILCNFDVDIC
jgi:hypothetical protein